MAIFHSNSEDCFDAEALSKRGFPTDKLMKCLFKEFELTGDHTDELKLNPIDYIEIKNQLGSKLNILKIFGPCKEVKITLGDNSTPLLLV